MNSSSPCAEPSAYSFIGNPEPAFHSLSGYTLRVGRADHDMVNYLAANIESGTGDLLCHVRRVFMALDLQDPDELFGALVDVFIAKGSSAFDVRSNLLRKSASLLSPQQHELLSSYLSSGISAFTPIAAPRSRLTAGAFGADQATAAFLVPANK